MNEILRKALLPITSAGSFMIIVLNISPEPGPDVITRLRFNLKETVEESSLCTKEE